MRTTQLPLKVTLTISVVDVDNVQEGRYSPILSIVILVYQLTSQYGKYCQPPSR